MRNPFGILLVAVLPGLLAETVRCPASRDVWLSSYHKERDFNMGAAPKLKLKIHQEFALIDFDVRELRGRDVRAAWLVVCPAGGHKYGFHGDTDLSWLTVSTVAHPWVEGKSTGYREDSEGHGATFNESSSGRDGWGWPGAKVCDVALGHACTLRHDARLEPAGKGKWRLPLDVGLVQALVAGTTHGLMIMDGATHVSTNCFIASRESGNGPVLEAELGPRSGAAPQAVEQLDVAPAPGEAGERVGALAVTYRTPRNAFGYEVECNGKAVPRWQVPLATASGSRQSFVLRDLPPEALCAIRVRPVSADGQAGPWQEAKGRTSPALRIPRLPDATTSWQPAAPPTLGSRTDVYVLPPLTKLDPVTGKGRGEDLPAAVARGNSLWDAGGRRVVLDAARGEITSFQVVVDGPVADGSLTLSGFPAKCMRLWRTWYVQGLGEYALPDAASFRVPMPDSAVANQRLQAFTVDIHVPTTAPVGERTGKLVVGGNGQSVSLAVQVRVHAAVIPDVLTFRSELNCYGGPGRAGSAKFRDSHRLAHYHRCTINRVPYNQSGRVHEDMAPTIDGAGRIVDWTAYDRDLGGLLDGTWFADNPRAGVPVAALYLPLHEGWPLSFLDYYRPGEGLRVEPRKVESLLRHDALAAPPDEALAPEFGRAFAAAARSFYDHFAERGWNRTIMECYLNDKPSFGYTLWTMDEPVKYRDWAALNHFARLFKDALPNRAPYGRRWHEQCFRDGVVNPGPDQPVFLFRGDVSRPEWQGSVSDGLMTMMVANNGQFLRPRTMAALRDRLPASLYAYGSCNAPAKSNWESVAWCVKAFAHGCEGVVPWQSLAGGGALTRPDPNGLIVDAGTHGHAVASFRVHALRQGAQICELLRLLQIKRGWSREHIRLLVGRELGLAAGFAQSFADEAAALSFADVDAERFLRFQRGVLALLDQ